MKYIIFILLLSGYTISQDNYKMIRMENSISNGETKIQNISKDFNMDGNNEILRGSEITKISKREYWIKNTELILNNGDVYNFSKILLKNNSAIIEQVSAEYGYILVFKNKSSVVEVYVADAKGDKNSDALFLQLK